MPIPKVSIGMPVYNGEKDIRGALDCLLAQTFADFELIISDNGSTDCTGAICLEYAANDPRIRYIRQPENRGVSFNLQFVLDEARGEYFTWAACDDVRSTNYLEVNVSFLEQNHDFVASTSPTRFDNGHFNAVSMGDASLDGNRVTRVIKFFDTWHSNGRFYSLIRRNALKGCPFITSHFLANDWAVVLFLANLGKLHRNEEGYVIFGTQGQSNSTDIFRRFRKTSIDLFLPFYNLFKTTFAIFGDIPLAAKLRLTWIFVKLNYRAQIIQARYYLRK
jgi:glycosyltransferase involved in cell wall biosynthesis